MTDIDVSVGNNAVRWEALQAEPSDQGTQQIRVTSPTNQAAYLRLVTSARSDCLNLSTSMYKKLPREIRDMVYGYLCLDDRQIPIGPYYHYRSYWPPSKDDALKPERPKIEPFSEEWFVQRLSSLPRGAETVQPDGRIRTDHDVYPQDDLLMPEDYRFHPSYMGKEVALETLKTYYESNSFSVCNIEGGLDTLCTSVTLGPEATDFVPIDHVCDLQIRVKCEHFTSPNTFMDKPWERLKGFAADELSLRSTVESLAAFRSKIQTMTARELNIEVVLMSTLITKSEQYRAINMLQTIRNFVYELVHDCEHTTIRVTHQDESIMAFPKNYTGLFQLTKEQWDYEKSKQQPNHDWSQDFWILPIEGDDFSEDDYNNIGGYYENAQETFLTERWGITDVMRETTSLSAPVQGFSWPVGCPYHPAAARELADRLEAEAEPTVLEHP